MASDTSAVIINETMASKLGWADPLGKQIDRGGNHKMHIIGPPDHFQFNPKCRAALQRICSPVSRDRSLWLRVAAAVEAVKGKSVSSSSEKTKKKPSPPVRKIAGRQKRHLAPARQTPAQTSFFRS